jgi:aspartate/methionine/tyrosine aminotransferase
MAGDPDFIDFSATQRNVAAPQVPVPAQNVAVAAYGDEAHVEEYRRLYNEKYAAAEAILGNRFGYRTPPGGFFLWLDMREAGGGEAAAIRLWREAGVRTLPGGYLAIPNPDGSNPGDPVLRLAMVTDLATTTEALGRFAAIFD